MSTEACSADILAFWFGKSSQVDISYRARRKLWFGKSAAFDAQVRQRFKSLYAAASSGIDWPETPDDRLALALLLDQFPRNMFRGTPAAFASDPQARAVSRSAIAQGFDQAVSPLRRMFFYFPLEHSESLMDQQQAIDCFKGLVDQAPELQDTFDYAIRHQRVIQRFGRFPHRNPILGRLSTPAEVAFLKQPGSSF